MSPAAASSASVGGRSRRRESAFSARASLRWLRTRLIGSLIVRALASIPRSTARRLHQDAHVEHRAPLPQTKFSTALSQVSCVHVDFLHTAHHPDNPLVDKEEQRERVALVFLRNGNEEPQVRID